MQGAAFATPPLAETTYCLAGSGDPGSFRSTIAQVIKSG